MTLTMGSGEPVIALAFIKAGIAKSKNLPLLQRKQRARCAGKAYQATTVPLQEEESAIDRYDNLPLSFP
jgi:hypothetical protein